MNRESNKPEAGQVNTEAARVYDAFFVPALFGAWAEPLCRAVGVAAGDRVLDVACGTGVAAREAARLVGTGGSVTGLDRNAGMLAVARQQSDDVVWTEGLAENIPFADDSFDVVLCQFGLMFFEDRIRALKEMQRVAKPDGRSAVAVWDKADNSPGYASMIALIDRMFGKQVADALRAPFVLGDLEELRALLDAAGWSGATIETQVGAARFPSIDDWVKTDVRGWTLADLIDDRQYADLKQAANAELAHYADASGAVSFAAPAHIVTVKPA